ncbi:probable cytochrome P450 6a13 [Macrosteles quadrilineatus]|uniref:probable cytochrome P450 6a13 n=1 Tax=Macrosteles quadrilineatus TaxID=74068 RepID=UPI0023E1CB53|nr:probable cytochrome P450 6a13 [Macrosteles quadrilineatus]
MGVVLENTIVELLYVSLLVFWIIYLYFVKDYGYWEERHVPHVPPVFPLGSMSDIVLGRVHWGIAYDKIYKEYANERFVGLIDIRKPCLVVRDPDLIKRIMARDFNHFMDHMVIDIHPNDYLMNHLFHLRGQEWKEMRAKLTPAYTAAKMKMMFFLVKRCSDVLREFLEKSTRENNKLDVKDIFSRYTIDVISSCAFGLDINCLSNKDSEFYKIGLRVMKLDFEMLLKLFIYNSFPILSKFHLFDFIDSKITHFLTDVIRSTIDYREKNNINRYDFLDLLIKLKQNQSILEEGEKDDTYDFARSSKKEGMTVEEITAETFLFFAAGFETTSNTITFCLYELACNYKIQEKLHWEVEEVLERHNNEISYQALQEMTYMDQVINESMRRYPVFPVIFRHCTERYRVPDSNLVIEKDTKIIIPAYSLHHDPEYFPDPYTFDPERFSAKNCKTRHPFVFLPFGDGPRMCIGFRFGLMKVKTALATLLLDYEINITPDTEVPLTFRSSSFTTLPSKPLMLVFNRRDDRV